VKAKAKGEIVNGIVVAMLEDIIEKLAETVKDRIFKTGFEKAVEMLEKGEEKGVFLWVPRSKYWLKDQDYIFWLGTNLSLNLLRKVLSTTFLKSLIKYASLLRGKKCFPTTFLPLGGSAPRPRKPCKGLTKSFTNNFFTFGKNIDQKHSRVFSFSTGFLFIKKKKCCVNLVKSRGFLLNNLY